MKNNKNTKTKKYLDIKSIFALIGLCAFFSASCSTLGGFNRNTAANLIAKDKRYSQPATITIDIGRRSANTGIGISQMTIDETVEQAAARAKEDFATDQPQLIVAEQLGFIKLYFENGELGERPIGAPRYDNKLAYWTFHTRVEITDKGRSLWKDLSLPVNEENLPLAVRGTPDVTGIKDENQTMKSVDFTYQWQANELGKAFNESSTVFKNLPLKVQQSLKNTKFDMFGKGNNRLMDFDVARSARALFQKFDDGWRLGELYFM